MRGIIFNSIFFMIFYNFIIYQVGVFLSEPDIVTHRFIKTIVKENTTFFDKVIIDEENNYAYFYNYTDKPIYKTRISSKSNFYDELKSYFSNNFDKLNIIFETSKSFFSYLVNYTLTFFMIYTVLSFLKLLFFRGKTEGESGFNLSSIVFPEQGFNISKNIETRFDDVIGLKTVKEDLKQYVDMVNNRQKYIDSGAKLPKGLLFTGPPGTGKTLLARALAGETGTSFISVSGSDFIEVFVGVGAQRVRNLFRLARKYSPCIVFIDEIDAVGRKRSGSSNGGHSEQGQTMNKLLCEMDGFTENDNIMVIAATNMKSVLDNALTRSGRFDRNIVFESPNINERQELFKLYLKKIKLCKTIEENLDENCKKLAKMTGGLSGADIANISNQAIISHIKKKEKENGATFEDIEQAIDEVMVGMKKIERLMTDEERNIVAHHEAGHALIAYILKNTDPPVKVSIVPRGDAALGFSQQEPKDKKLYTTDELTDKICVFLGGRVAEELMFNQITTGASDDIEKVTQLAYSMITVYGMDRDIGTVNHKLVGEYEHIMSDSTKAKIDEQVNILITDQYDRTYEILEQYKNELIIIAEHLLETELLLGEEISNLIDKDNVLKNSI